MEKRLHNKKKYGSVAFKLCAMVVAMLVVSNLISIILVVNNSRILIRSSVKNSMMNMAQSSSELVSNELRIQDNKSLPYEEYARILGDAKLNGVDSSYVYVVSPDGTMLYHPAKDKVGQPVENGVVKGLVEQINAGKHPEPAIIDYTFNGVTKYAAYIVLDNNDIVVVSADESDVLAGINDITRISGFILLGIIAAAFIIAYLFSKSIAKPLTVLSQSIAQIAAGNLNTDFTQMRKSNDEIGLITEEMQSMTGTLHDIVAKIRSASDIMAQSSDHLNETSGQTLSANNEISRAIQDIAEGSTNMVGSISDINDNLGTMSTEAQGIDDSVADIQKQTAAVQTSSQTMNDKILQMQESSEKMDTGINAISVRIGKVSDVVDKVSDIISVIEDISGQTNLLSLNASIEAARAGEAGKGFAVVAEEIRVLSDNTKKELDNIKTIISELVNQCNSCVSDSNEIVEQNHSQKDAIALVLDEFQSLNSKINQTALKAGDIKNQVDQMVLLNDNIMQASNDLGDVSSANAAATEEMTANIDELNTMMHGVSNMAEQMQAQSTELSKTLAYFK